MDNGVLFDTFVSFGWPGFCPECPADLDGDDRVGFDDLTQLLGAWGLCDGCAEDLDGDATVGFNGLTKLLGAWGACP